VGRKPKSAEVRARAVLVQRRKVSSEALRHALTDGWLACAPRALAEQYAPRPSHAAESDTLSWPVCRS
jgi:FAD synthase